MSDVRTVHSKWENAVLVCRKCSKRADGGFGSKGKTSLAKALKKFLGVKKGRKASIGVIEVDCLGLCPKHAVTVVNTARPDEWLVVQPGTSMEALAQRLRP